MMPRPKILPLAAAALFALLLTPPARSQVLDSPYRYDNPALQQDAFVRNMNAIAIEGLMQRHMIEESVGGRRRQPAAAGGASPTKFRGSREFLLADLLARQTNASPAQKAEAAKVIERMVVIYADTAVKDGFPANDLAYAFQYYVVQNYHVYHNVFEDPSVIPWTNTIDVSKTPNYVSSFGEKALFEQFKRLLSSNPAIAKLSDARKQQYTELLAVITNLNFVAYSDGLKRKDVEVVGQARLVSKQHLERLFGVPADKIVIGDEGISFRK